MRREKALVHSRNEDPPGNWIAPPVAIGAATEVTKPPRPPVPSRDFVAVKLQLDTMAVAAHKDAAGANAAAQKLALLVEEPGQRLFVQQIITMQVKG